MYAIRCSNTETSYNISDFYSFHNASQATRHYAINPALTEVSVSTIAHYLFPNNFARYLFFSDTQSKIEADAGYILQYDLVECGNSPIGVENVYATAFFLGLKIKSHSCIAKDGGVYLYVDDFARSLHRIDKESGGLIDEYRGSKTVPTSTEMLFPNELMDKECGKWIGAMCDTEKLKDAYKTILDKGDSSELCHIGDMAINASQNIECQNNNAIKNQNADCASKDYEGELYAYFAEHVHLTVLANYVALRDLYSDVADWI